MNKMKQKEFLKLIKNLKKEFKIGKTLKKLFKLHKKPPIKKRII